MKNIILIFIFFLSVSCTKPKTVFICGDHICVNKTEAQQYFEENLTLEVKVLKKRDTKEPNLIELNLSEPNQVNKQVFVSKKERTNKEIKKLSDNEKKKIISNVKKKQFPTINILNLIPSKISLFDTVLVSSNDELVNLYLNSKISYNDISRNILKFLNLKEFTKLKNKIPHKIEVIVKINKYVRLKLNTKDV